MSAARGRQGRLLGAHPTATIQPGRLLFRREAKLRERLLTMLRPTGATREAPPLWDPADARHHLWGAATLQRRSPSSCHSSKRRGRLRPRARPPRSIAALAPHLGHSCPPSGLPARMYRQQLLNTDSTCRQQRKAKVKCPSTRATTSDDAVPCWRSASTARIKRQVRLPAGRSFPVELPSQHHGPW